MKSCHYLGRGFEVNDSLVQGDRGTLLQHERLCATERERCPAKQKAWAAKGGDPSYGRAGDELA
jgi:hypothetical protein